MRHAHTVSDEPLSLSDRQSRDHLALVACRRENVRLNDELRSLRDRRLDLLHDLAFHFDAIVEAVERFKS
jgi:hypothetical protein